MSFKLLCWLLEISEMINMLTDIHLRAFPVFVSWKSPLNILIHSECFVGSVNNWSTEAAINASPEVDIGSGRCALRLSKVIQGMLIAGLMTSLEPYKGCVARLGCKPLSWNPRKPAGTTLAPSASTPSLWSWNTRQRRHTGKYAVLPSPAWVLPPALC